MAYDWKKEQYMKYGIVSFFLCITISFFCIQSYAIASDMQWKHSKKIEDLFQAAGVTGTFVLYDPENNTVTGYNQSRANERFFPASTFKLVNSLIGLSTGAVKSVDEVLPFGGASQDIKAWEKDMGLREAIRMSNVPIYQELARRIGLIKMRETLAVLHYGNEQTGSVVDRFWLDGPLTISALEQAYFCAALAQGTLPFAANIQSAVREISLVEKAEEWTLFGKTGVASAAQPQVGWWVGWVQKGSRVYAFALNMDMLEYQKDLPKRIQLGRSALSALGILP